MHYYQHNIADYRKDTGHLTLLEHGIYRQLLDSYYLHEKPIETKRVIRRLQIKTDDEKNALDAVLSDFFVLSECGEFYSHCRCEREIEQYQGKAERARVNGAKGGRPKKPKKTKAVNSGLAKKTKAKANHKPITNNHKPIPQGINPASWGEFEKHRKEIRKPLSELARTKAMNVIIDMSFDDQAKVIDKTIQNRWTGLFPEKGNGTDKSLHESNHSRVVRQLAEKIRDE